MDVTLVLAGVRWLRVALRVCLSVLFACRCLGGAVALTPSGPARHDAAPHAAAAPSTKPDAVAKPATPEPGLPDGAFDDPSDPFNRRLAPRSYRHMKEEMRGSFGGLGMVLGGKNGRLAVLSTLVGSPAYRAGMRGGDLLVKVNDRDTDGASLERVARWLRGAPGTTVKLSILRDRETSLRDLVLTRVEIRVPSVRARMVDARIGYAHLSSFTRRAAEELDAIVTDFERAGMKSFILDLRQNPGGLLETTVKVAQVFLSFSLIMTVRNRVGEVTPYFAREQRHGRFRLIVLIDSGSGSASEAVAGAIKDNRRGLLLGERSLGKGSVQAMDERPDGSAVATTTAFYYTPGGACIHRVGIEPDIKVELPESADDDAWTFRQDWPEAPGDGTSGAGRTPVYLTVSPQDTQLSRAVAILRGPPAEFDRLLDRSTPIPVPNSPAGSDPR